MSMLETFFKGSDTEFGVFYPRNYMVVVFDNLAQAQEAERRLHWEGFPEDELVAVPGVDVVMHADEHVKKAGVSGYLMGELSRIFGTEAVYADKDLTMASEGAGFLVVHCPSEKSKLDAWGTVKELGPLVARHYSLGGIEHLTGEV